MANIAAQRIKREFKEVVRSEEVSEFIYYICVVYIHRTIIENSLIRLTVIVVIIIIIIIIVDHVFYCTP